MLGTWVDGSLRKFAIGRLTFWFVHMSLESLFSFRFWLPNFHNVVRGGIMRGSWGPVAFDLHAKEIS
jgi:hypothetical protein